MSSINTNISAYYAQNNLRKAASDAQASIARLSSGNRIVSASDDVSGLAIGTVLRTDVSTLKTASSNASQGTTLLQIADGALSSLGDILQRQKALAVQANSGTLSDTERGYLNQEFQSLTSEYNRIVGSTNFNGVQLLDGSIASSGGKNTSATVATSDYNATTTATSFTFLNTTGVNGTAFIAANFSTTANNTFQGSLKNAVVTGVYDGTAKHLQLNININGVQYVSDDNADNTAAHTYTFTAKDGSGQTFGLAVKGGTATGSQANADTIAAGIQAELSTITVYQNRSIATTDISAASLSNTTLAGLSGADFKLLGDNFGAVAGSTTKATLPTIGAFNVVSNSSTDASFSISINGHTYKNDHVTVDSNVTNNDLGNGAADGKLVLTSVDDPASKFVIDLGTNSTGAINLSTSAAAATFQDSVNKAIGSSSFGGLNFQVGSTSADKINISLNSLSTTNVYKDSTGAAQTLDISTQTGAQSASDVLSIAIGTLTSARSNVGALQERFNYVTATLGTSIQNLDAARSQFLDTDVSAESTRFATEQVLQQAAISVLAQANQIPQNLLKLIG